MGEQMSEKEHQSALILANVGELTTAVIKKVAGNDISTAVNGSPVTREVIQSLVTRKVVEQLTPKAG